MKPRWLNLREQDRALYRVITAFLDGRLEDRETIDWALRLNPNDSISRLALLDLFDAPSGRKIAEPWLTAWRLIEESWSNTAVEDHTSTGVYNAQHRLRAGDRSRALVTSIVDLVAPRLKVEPFSDMHLHYKKLSRMPKKVENLFSMSLTSGEIVDPGVLGLASLDDRSFLLSLALALDAAVTSGLDIARRIGWDGERRLWQLGGLHRVYFVPVAERADGEHEPDEFHHGIAPSVKLLYEVVLRLADVDNSAAIEFARRWKLTNSPIHLRLWAALSRDSRITPANEVGAVLLSLDNRRFWNLNDYPEIAELRAARFGELNPREQATLTTRIRKRPPRNQWPREAETDRVESGRLYWAVRELRRIEIAGAHLPQRDKVWLDEKITAFPALVQMARLDEGFSSTLRARAVPPNPDSRYDLLAGEERLNALETALNSPRRGWDDEPAERASDWIRQPGNTLHMLVDFESIPDGGAAFARVWERFGWTHSPETHQGEDATRRDLQSESARVLAILDKLPEATVNQAIDGISHWLASWEKHIVALPEGLSVWLKLWPIAVSATNTKPPTDDRVLLNAVTQASDDREPMDLDTLNTPAGKLVGVFLAACPNLEGNKHPFENGGAPRIMRDAIIAVSGRSGLIARHRMIEALSYFLRADSAWTNEYLITPLLSDSLEAIALWRAIARRTRFFDVLGIIGGPMSERATDRQLGRETRRSLVFSLIIECLYAFRDQREPAVPYAQIQQMIRSLDDEVRAYGAEAVQRFVRDVSVSREGEPTPPSPEQLFLSSAKPFLQEVWPQERSLATPGVSRALADLPAAARELFADAVDSIERFLVPFESWSMHDYGLYGEEDGKPKLSIIDTQEKASAFLRLLDKTIGTAEGTVVPHDLADALDQIRRIAPDLAENRVFRRLATTARRG